MFAVIIAMFCYLAGIIITLSLLIIFLITAAMGFGFFGSSWESTIAGRFALVFVGAIGTFIFAWIIYHATRPPPDGYNRFSDVPTDFF